MGQEKGRVLCVDDEPSILRSLQWLLQKEFEVFTASSGHQGLALVRLHDFDVVISDQRMPGMSGSEFLREVRKASPRALRILLTGYSDLQAILKSVNEGEVFRFINKPWNMAELPRIVAEAATIARSQSARSLVANESGGHELTSEGGAILVVDDDPAVLDLLRQLIGSDKRMVHARSLAEAVEFLSSEDISVIVADTRVGNSDTTRLLKMLKQQHPQVVTVIFSADSDAADIIALINQGQIYRFVPRPVRSTFLRETLESALDKHNEISANPDVAKRYTVQAIAADVGKSLLVDVEQAAGQVTADRQSATGSDSFRQKVTDGFRRLFKP